MSIYEAIEEAQKHCRFHKPDCGTCIFANMSGDTFFCEFEGRFYDLSDTRSSSLPN